MYIYLFMFICIYPCRHIRKQYHRFSLLFSIGASDATFGIGRKGVLGGAEMARSRLRRQIVWDNKKMIDFHYCF